MANDGHHSGRGFSGPLCWVVSIVVGALLGVLAARLAPAQMAAPGAPGHGTNSHPGVIEHRPDGSEEIVYPLPNTPHAHAGEAAAKNDAHAGPAAGGHGPVPIIPVWLCVPFAVLLLCIATMPFINERFWHRHYPDVAFLLGSMAAAYYLRAFGDFGRHTVLHTGIEYYSFIALVGGLYVVSGGILVRFRSRGTPLTNTLVLAVGAVLANLVGTTGASVLLIRPFMRMNEGRLRPIHIVFFIFIVSNCGGCLTPIGDPPLYLGFLKGVPFFWTLGALWPMWLACVGVLLFLFFQVDLFIARRSDRGKTFDRGPDAGAHRLITIQGLTSIIALGLLVAGVFVDPLLKQHAGIEGLPIGATFQIVVAIGAYFIAKPGIREANHFNFHPVKEVGLLFIGIFATMMPALGYLQANGSTLGIESPTQYYFATGVLSAVLDNAPTYLSFLQLSFSVLGFEMNPDTLHRFIDCTYTIVHADGVRNTVRGAVLLEGISLGAVFFGAMTYIGNGPNFMVKSIADSSGKVKMPSFFGYLMLSAMILGPVLVLIWAVFIR